MIAAAVWTPRRPWQKRALLREAPRKRVGPPRLLHRSVPIRRRAVSGRATPALMQSERTSWRIGVPGSIVHKALYNHQQKLRTSQRMQESAKLTRRGLGGTGCRRPKRQWSPQRSPASPQTTWQCSQLHRSDVSELCQHTNRQLTNERCARDPELVQPWPLAHILQTT